MLMRMKCFCDFLGKNVICPRRQKKITFLLTGLICYLKKNISSYMWMLDIFKNYANGAFNEFMVIRDEFLDIVGINSY